MMLLWPVGMIRFEPTGGGFKVDLEPRRSVENRLTVTVLASISVNMNSPPSKSPLRYNRALGKEEGEGQNGLRVAVRKTRAGLCPAGRTCSLCRCRPGAPSSTRWPRGPADSCRRGWGDSGRSCGPAGLLAEQCSTHKVITQS